MKVLFLTDEFYPNFGANSLLVKTLAKEFIQNEQQVFVMPFSYDKTLPKEENCGEIKVVRVVPSDDKLSLVNNLKSGHFLTAFKVLCKYLKNKLVKKQSIFSKDKISARRVLKKFILDNKIDVVISICCSIELSFPLLYLRKKNKLPCKWIFYMIDPFESHQYYRSIEKVSVLRKLQHEIMLRCDRVVATSLIYNDTKEWESNEILEKIEVVEFPKIEKLENKPCDDDIYLDNDKVNVVCTGTKNEMVRNSAYALTVCENLDNDNLLFHFVGKGWAEYDVVKKKNCLFYREHSHQAIINLQTKADFLLNIGNVVANQLPSKVLEYISTCKPIINIAKSNDCPTIELLNGVNSITVFENEFVEKSVDKIREFIKRQNGEINFDTIIKNCEKYTPKFVAERFMSLFGANK